uniref:Uncharacterized protein n=1 Tax=Clytia hemisphaerica TaxID=252671 RepID=A0A7M5UND5_9CNID
MYKILTFILLASEICCQWIPVEKNEDSPCYNYKCPFGQRCVIINNQPICKCNHNCDKSEKTGPVCTKSGRTYPNLCKLKQDECKRGDYIMVDHFGACKTGAIRCYDNKKESELGLCKQWKEHGACTKHTNLMKRFCRATCDMCDVKALPAACMESKFGCCPGNKIQALGPRNKGCFNGCRDGRLCPFFPNFCGDEANKETMKKFCPYTCRYCVPEGNEHVEILTEDNL